MGNKIFRCPFACAEEEEEHFHNLKDRDRDEIDTNSTVSTNDHQHDCQECSPYSATLIQSILPFVLPLFRRLGSKKLIEKGIVLRDEEPVVPIYEPHQPDDSLPLKDVNLTLEGVHVVDYSTLREDMEAYPDFVWPERDTAEKLLNPAPGEKPGMVVFDMLNAELEIKFARGIELTCPISALGVKMNIEIGSGGEIEEASIRMKGPRLRFWFVFATRQLFVSFMERPDIIPYLHVNADRGKGDFASVLFTEKGTDLDDVLEKILAGFGPKFASEKKRSDFNHKLKSLRSNMRSAHHTGSWVGEAVGGLLIKLMSSFTPVKAGSALELPVKDNFNNEIERFLGHPRPDKNVDKQLAKIERESETDIHVEKILFHDCVS